MFVGLRGKATFECIYEESVQATAVWEINNRRYVFSSVLPPKHWIDSTGSYLTVCNVDLSMNGSTYQCIVDSHYSTVGHLIISQGQPCGFNFVSIQKMEW